MSRSFPTSFSSSSGRIIVNDILEIQKKYILFNESELNIDLIDAMDLEELLADNLVKSSEVEFKKKLTTFPPLSNLYNSLHNKLLKKLKIWRSVHMYPQRI